MLLMERHRCFKHTEQRFKLFLISCILQEDGHIAQSVQIAGVLLQHLIQTFLRLGEPAHIEMS